MQAKHNQANPLYT